MFNVFKKAQEEAEQFMLDLPKVPEYTPDLGWLEQYEYQLLFSPDETQRTMAEYSRIASDSAFIANVYSMKDYDFWEQRVGSEQIGIPLPPSGMPTGALFPRPCKIKGELHCMKPSAFIGLDEYKQNTIQFIRKRVNVLIPHRPLLNRNVSLREAGKELPRALQGDKTMLGLERVHIIRAWMYVGIPEYWDSLLCAGWDGFKHVPRLSSKREWLGEYTYLTKHEFKS